MAMFFIENKHGQFFSADGKRRFDMLKGKEALDYLSEHKGLRFYDTRTAEEGGDTVFVEAPKHLVKKVERWKNRENYIKRVRKESGLKVFSLSQSITDDEEITLEDTDCIRTDSFEDDAIHNIYLDTLRRALDSLTAEEYCIIECLFFAENPMTERELAESMGKSQPYINRLKGRIFEKIKKFF